MFFSLKNKKLFIVGFIVTLLSCKTSINKTNNASDVNYIPYYSQVYKADSLFLTNNFQKSYNILDSLFQKYEPHETENINEYSTYIACSVLTGNTDNIETKIRKGYSKFGGIGITHPKRDSIGKVLIKYNLLTIEEKRNLRKEYFKQFDPVLRNRIERMFKEDEAARVPELDYVTMRFYQKKHKKEIKEIIAKYRYPDYQVIGSTGSFEELPVNFMIIFMHQKDSFKKKYLKMLYDNMVNGKLAPEEYAIIVDRTYLEKKKSIYGTIIQPELTYPKKLDSIRATIGLPNVDYQMWAFKKRFPDT